MTQILPRNQSSRYDRLVSRLLLRTTLVLSAAALIVASCAHRSSPPAAEHVADDLDAHPLRDYTAAFVLRWQGVRVGDATERVHQRGDTIRYVRHERITVRRAGAVIELETRINIEADTSLRARRVTVRRRAGATTISGVAQRDRDARWRVWFGNEPMRTIDGAAVPAELVPLMLASKRRKVFSGPVFLPGFGFAEAELRISAAPTPGSVDRVRAVATTSMGQLESTIEFLRDGTVARIRGADSSEATRVDQSTTFAAFVPPELVDSASLAVSGPSPPSTRPVILELTGPQRPPPPLPGQRISTSAQGWWVELAPGDAAGSAATRYMEQSTRRSARDARRADARGHAANPTPISMTAERIVRAAGAAGQRAELVALTVATETILADDLNAPGIDAANTLALGRGDCTAHASLLAALAKARGIETRFVTGYRLDSTVLVRHRWIVARLPSGWIAVDPTYGEAPALGRLVGLATHTGSAADLAMVDELAFAGYQHARFRFAPSRRPTSSLATGGSTGPAFVGRDAR